MSIFAKYSFFINKIFVAGWMHFVNRALKKAYFSLNYNKIIAGMIPSSNKKMEYWKEEVITSS